MNAQGLLTANLLCQPHARRLDVFPTAAVFSFLPSLGGSCPAQHPWCSFSQCLSPSNGLGCISWEDWSWCKEWSEQQV